jgi:hypothetical protein
MTRGEVSRSAISIVAGRLGLKFLEQGLCLGDQNVRLEPPLERLPTESLERSLTRAPFTGVSIFGDDQYIFCAIER